MDFDSSAVFRDTVRNLFLTKIYGYAGIYRGYLVVIPPVIINQDESEAFLYLPTMDRLKIPNIDDILKIITFLKLFPSLDQYQIQANLDEAIKAHNPYVLIAKGRSMEEAFNDYVIPSVSLEKSVGKIKEDGKIDYKERGTIKEVFTGDIVGDFYKGTPGKEGFNVFGQRIAIIRTIKGAAPGKNLYQDPENPKVMKSQINGFLEIKQNVLDVNETLVIFTDIDYDTGNIEFSGNIEIKGKICDGFTVTSFGNLVVHGVVEGANLFSRNDMTLISGVISKPDYKIECHGNFKARFIQNANVKVKKSINVDEFIYDSHVECNEIVRVVNKTGVIVGGRVTALKRIEANVAGNKSGVVTELVCGVDQELGNKIDSKKKDLMRFEEAKNKFLEKLKQTYSLNFLRNPADYISKLPEEQKATAIQWIEKMKSLNQLIENTVQTIDKLEKIGDNYDFTPEIVILQKKYDGVKERIVGSGKSSS